MTNKWLNDDIWAQDSRTVELETQVESLKAQVAELRSVLGTLMYANEIPARGGHYFRVRDILASPNPGEDLLAKAAECDRMRQELAQLKESNDAACKGYVEAVDRILVEKEALEKENQALKIITHDQEEAANAIDIGCAELSARVEVLEKFVRAQPCGCYPATGYRIGNGDEFLEVEPAFVCARCKALGENQ